MARPNSFSKTATTFFSRPSAPRPPLTYSGSKEAIVPFPVTGVYNLFLPRLTGARYHTISLLILSPHDLRIASLHPLLSWHLSYLVRIFTHFLVWFVSQQKYIFLVLPKIGIGVFANDLLQRLKAGLVCAAGVCSRQELGLHNNDISNWHIWKVCSTYTLICFKWHFKWTHLKRKLCSTCSYVALVALGQT